MNVTSDERAERRHKRAARLKSLALMGVWYAIALHLLWAGTLITSNVPTHVTGIHILSSLLGSRALLSTVLIAVAGLALIAVFLQRNTIPRILLLAPQQIILGISAAGAVQSMYTGRYADGIARPHLFLIVDQAPAVLALLTHSATIIYLAALRRWQ